ncbi:MAG: RES family NAD+ phosphorylase [Armatimonadota bacterium]
MIEAYRVVQNQARTYALEATESPEQAGFLEEVLEASKPELLYPDWHVLIATPFRYPLPVPPAYQARFKPPYSLRNVLYCCRKETTALFEAGYHFLRERVGRTEMVPESGRRTIFSLSLLEEPTHDIRSRRDIKKIMDRLAYGPSHRYINSQPRARMLLYPSCREPDGGDNFACFEIEALGKRIGGSLDLDYYFSPERESIVWSGQGLEVFWKTAS